MSFIFLKWTKTYIYNVSIAFLLNNPRWIYLKSLWIWKCIPSRARPLAVNHYIKAELGNRTHNRSIFTINKCFSPAWTSLTVYMPIDAHKQTADWYIIVIFAIYFVIGICQNFYSYISLAMIICFSYIYIFFNTNMPLFYVNYAY